ncbi:hypothetical protein O181_015001 [Austropuccinia psidii MF-1]|uniref:Uncharacterized protein n=1 Tax=Austropuccinia psidii MF-1 TaxID=1389203 RepID=A0A9Q3GPP0_9BASI|nr:hypothetical protein [Austropuccinia psidii MF-1]
MAKREQFAINILYGQLTINWVQARIATTPIGGDYLWLRQPTSIIIIGNTPIGSPHSHNETQQEFTDLQLTLMIPQAVVHESISQILLEHCQFLHMIPFLDVTHQNEMHQEFWEELKSLLGQELEAYPKEDITGIVSVFPGKQKKLHIVFSL